MSKISRPDVTSDLSRFFLSAGENPTPIEISEEVLFTFPFAAPTVQLRFPVFEIRNGSVGIPGATFTTLFVDSYFIVHSVSMTHSDGAAPHKCRISIINSENSAQLIDFGFDRSIATDERVIVRNLVVPPKWQVRMDVEAIAAGASVIGRMLFTEHNLAQPLLGLSS